MNIKIISIVLLVLGIVLVLWGVQSSESLGSDISRFFTGAPTDKTVWLLIAGVVAGLLGFLGLVRGAYRD